MEKNHTTGKLYKHWQKEQRIFQPALAGFGEKTDTHDIHTLRVSFKKLRAYTLLACTDEQDPSPLLKLDPAEQLFNALGKQRNVEICRDLVNAISKEKNKYCPGLHRYLRHQHREAIHFSAKAIAVYESKPLLSLKYLMETEDGALMKKIGELVGAREINIRKAFREPHRLRRLLKTIYYWILLVTDEKSEGPFYPVLLHDILLQLGRWNDLETSRKMIRHFRKDFLPASETEYPFLQETEAFFLQEQTATGKKAIASAKKWLEKLKTQ
ncbi:MAG: CHAD domain-containing protein [Chitinophagaceae bacterium]|nr:CHAD domain-containing protein [Chitinophagaceae bacterium]